MLVFLRKAAHTWVSKLLLLLLVVSFGIWGVSSSLFQGANDTVVAVGNQKVSLQDFSFAYQRQLSDLSRRFGTQLTRDQARALGLDSQVYAQVAAGAALDQLSADMNLGLSEDRLAQLIAEDPAFRGVSGQFDRQLFTSRLRNSGLNENGYIAERSKVAVRSQIVDAVANGFEPPQVLIDALKLYRDQSRTVEYLLLTNSNIDPVAPPAEDVLAAWFETVKASYRAPEYRSFSYVKLEPGDIADTASVSDEAIAEDYEKNKERYRVQGSRTIEQLSFTNREQADAAAAKLTGGTTFDALVAEQGKTATDVLLGAFTRENLPDPALAEAAFAVANDGGVTPVVEGGFGPVILRVTNIKPEGMRPLEEVKDEIRASLANSNAMEDIMGVHDKYEDLRASGSTLAEAAAELRLDVREVASMDRNGFDDKDVEIADLPERQALIAQVFQTEVGIEALPVNIGRDGYVWFEVRDTTPERDRTLEEVREKAIAAWTAEQQKIALGAKAEALKERVVKGETLEALATELSIAVETKSGLKRLADDPVLGSAAVTAAFAGAVDTVATATSADPASQILLKVTDVQDAPTGEVAGGDDAQVRNIASAAGDDILDQMVGRLQADYGVSINQTLAEQAVVR